MFLLHTYLDITHILAIMTFLKSYFLLGRLKEIEVSTRQHELKSFEERHSDAVDMLIVFEYLHKNLRDLIEERCPKEVTTRRGGRSATGSSDFLMKFSKEIQ